MHSAGTKRSAILLTGLLAGLILISSAWAAVPSLGGLVLWLDATDLDGSGESNSHIASGAKIARWVDKSGQANHVEQQDSSRQPTLAQDRLGGQAVLRFDGNDLLTRSRFVGFSVRDQPIHVILVMQSPESVARPLPRVLEFQPIDGDMSEPATVKQHGFWIGAHHDGRMRIETHYGDHGAALSAAWDDQPHVVEVIYEGAQRWVHNLDGARNGAGLFGDRDFHGFTKDLRLAIGQHFGSEHPRTFFEGDLAEVLVYDRRLSPEEQNAVKSYLGKKWSLNLSIEAVPHFERDILPILAQHCHDCHGDEVRESNVDLRTVTAMLRGGDSGPVISRGHPEFSDLVEQIVQGNMPPDDADPLDEGQIAAIRRWIEAEAPADEEIAQVDAAASISDEDRSFWAYQKLTPHQPPEVANANRVRTPIDAFMLAKLEPLGLSFTPEAHRVTLLRRVYFDLLGLPPSPHEMMQFLADQSDQAYERLIDRLLASQHFGERWGRSWLDWSGYVDVYGKDNDFAIIKPLEGRWLYRDYVVRAFNHDKPWDRFLIEQLAGDELVDWRNLEQLSPEMTELLTATGFLLCADDDSDQDELNTPDIRHYVLQQTGEIVASNLFALTVGCAKCHDHKYEAIAQLDYYRWLANFSPVFNPQRWVTSVEHGIARVPMEEKDAADRHNAEIEAEVAKLRKKMKALNNAADEQAISELEGKINALESTKQTYPQIQAAVEQSPPSPSYLLRRGEVPRPGVEVYPALFSIVTDDRSTMPTTKVAAAGSHRYDQPQGATSGRRLAIAKQVTDPDSIAGALVARVFVNRLWQELFGIGIVETSDNFGVSGARPTHPELLDWLAAEFIRGGWKVKPLVKTMMLSSVYRQDSIRQNNAGAREIDPANDLLWRARLRQLSSEHVRDRVLAVSGQLDPTIGGPPVPLLARPDGKIVIDMDSLPTPTSHLRRSLYILNRRNYHLSMLTTFDQPFMTSNCTCRKPSAVVTQSLTMMNDEFVLQQAEHFADRVAREAREASPPAWVDQAYQLALCRTPTDSEKQLCIDLLNRHTDRYQQAEMSSGRIPKKSAGPFLSYDV